MAAGARTPWLVVEENRRVKKPKTCVVALAGLVANTLVATDLWAGCETDASCKADEVCEHGRCAPSAPRVPTRGATIRVTATYPGTVFLDGAEVGRIDGKPFELTGVAPGRHQVEVETSTGVSGSAPVTVSAGDASQVYVMVPHEDYASTAALAAGAVLTGSGLLATLMGTPLTIAGVHNNAPSAVGEALLVGGLACLVSGITALAYGVQTVPAEDETDKSATLVEPLIGPTGGGLRVTF